jgi:hypothetical protein
MNTLIIFFPTVTGNQSMMEIVPTNETLPKKPPGGLPVQRGKAKPLPVTNDKKKKENLSNIGPDKTRRYWTAETKIQRKNNKELEIIKVWNYKKVVGKEAKLLVEYNDGRRDWGNIADVLEDVSDLVYQMMDECKISFEMLGYSGPLTKPEAAEDLDH